jgi:hypothetical protein
VGLFAIFTASFALANRAAPDYEFFRCRFRQLGNVSDLAGFLCDVSTAWPFGRAVELGEPSPLRGPIRRMPHYRLAVPAFVAATHALHQRICTGR